MARRLLDRTDLLDQAGRLAAKGDVEGAVDLYRKLFQQDPHDWSVGNTLGDLYVRMGRSEDATGHFLSLAEQLSSDGFAAKARAVYRKILRIQPDHAVARERLNDLERPEAGSVSPFLKRVLETARAAREATSDPVPQPLPASAATLRTAEPSAPKILKPPALETAKPIPAKPVEHAATPIPPAAMPAPSGPPIVQAALDPVSSHAAGRSDGFPASATEWGDEWTAVLSQRPSPLGSVAQRPVPPVAAVAPPSMVERDLRDFGEVVAAVDANVAGRDFSSAVTVIETFVETQPNHVEALEKLIDVGVDGGMEHVLVRAQTRLAEACLESGLIDQARNIAFDLMEREPDVSAHRSLLERIADIAPVEEETATGIVLPAVDQETYSDEPAEAAPTAPPEAVPQAGPAPEADPVFEEIRSALLEDAASAAEERLAEGTQLIELKKYDEAIPALEEAMCAPHLRASAGSKLACVHRLRGLAMEAFECLEWVAELPPPTEESGHELAYQLALTLEAIGQESQALGVYRELLAEVGPGFRDVAQRADRLAAA